MYYDGKAKDFYEVKMGSMAYQNYRTKFLELLRYVPYHKDKKPKVKIFVSGSPLSFIDQIEEVIGKLKHCYEY